MQTIGTIQKIMPIQSFRDKNGNTLSKVTFSLKEDNKQYPEEFVIVALNNTITQLEGITEGTKVSVIFSCRVHEYKGGLYQNNTLYKISKCGQHSTPQQGPTPQQAPEPQTGNVFGDNGVSNMPW